MSKKKIFIGCSVGNLKYAQAFQNFANFTYDVQIWNTIFGANTVTFEVLIGLSSSFDYAVFIFGPDDEIIHSNENNKITRDNVILEYGLFAGKIGFENVFFAIPNNVQNFKLPSDLNGIEPLKYRYLFNSERDYENSISDCYNHFDLQVTRKKTFENSNTHKLKEILGAIEWEKGIYFKNSIENQFKNVFSHFSFMGMGFQKYLEDERMIKELFNRIKNKSEFSNKVLIANPFSKKLDDFTKNEEELKIIQKRILETLKDIEKIRTENNNIEIRYYPQKYDVKPTFRLFFADEDQLWVSYYKNNNDGSHFSEIKILSKSDETFYFPFKHLFDFLWDNGEEGSIHTLNQIIYTSELSDKNIIDNIIDNIETETDIKFKFENNRICIAAVAGKDSIATILQASESGKYDLIIPIIISIPTEENEISIRLNSLKKIKEYLSKRKKISTLISSSITIIDNKDIWSSLTTELMFNNSMTGLSFPCIGCHFYIHLARCYVAKILKVGKVISGDRERHSSKIKLNQTSEVLDSLINFSKENYGIELEFPLRNIENDNDVFKIIYDMKIPNSSILDAKCIFNGKGSVDSKYNINKIHINNYINDLVIPNFKIQTENKFIV